MPAAGRDANRQVGLLSLLFGLSTTSGAVVVAAGSVVGARLSGEASLATLPVALALLGGMMATIPTAHAMARWGRRTGFLAGTTVALSGAALAATGIWIGSFVAFCAGSLLLGALGGVSPFYRFAAAEAVTPARQPRAVGFVLAGGVGAGLLGPPLGAMARDWWPAHPFAGSYLAMVALGTVVVALLFLLPRRGKASIVPAPGGRRFLHYASDRDFLAAVLAATTAFAAMVLIMVAAPLSLLHERQDFGATAFVIQAHIVAMFLPAFFAGRIVQRVGIGGTMAAGFAFLGACVVINLLGHTVAHHWFALVLLGFGWNLLFVAGTSLLVRAHSPADKAKVQGANDFLVAAVAAAAALGAGPLHAAAGWAGVNATVGALLAASAVALALLLRPGRSARAAETPAASGRPSTDA